MSRARNLADLLNSDGDVKEAHLDRVGRTSLSVDASPASGSIQSKINKKASTGKAIAMSMVFG
tara:strand:+ start:686 stop:874 length:189 start_codon:yes stop_codon:yes gene_type:complete